MNAVWLKYRGGDLLQGDLLTDCLVPIIGADFDADAADEIVVEGRDLIVVTQSCDLANDKTIVAALCPIYRLETWEDANPAFQRKGEWEQVRLGRREGLHLLASPEDERENRRARVVDFRQIFSLPIPYLKRHAAAIGDRDRLQSPYVEHFSQAFARFFMRVGLPVAIPPFK